MLKNKRQNKAPKKIKAFTKYSSMGFQMAAIMLLGAWGGIKLDSLLHTSKPYFTVGLIIVSVVLAIYSSIKDLLHMK